MALFEKPPPSSNRTKRRYVAIFAAVLAAVLLLASFRRRDQIVIPFRQPSAPQDDFRPKFTPPASDSAKDTGSSKAAMASLKAHGGYVHPNQSHYTTTLVMGRLSDKALDVQWVHESLHNITETSIYIVDDPKTDLPHLAKNHGREGMVYIQYILDNYDNLNDITFFWHSDEKVWHNNFLLGESSSKTINRMNREQIMEQGYVPSRCDHWPGCPSWVIFNPSIAEHTLDHHKLSDMFNDFEFGRIFPGEDDFPRYFAQPCCSQFAVSCDTIRSVPKDEYARVRDWIDNYESDQLSGRALEMLWQYIFLRKGTLCPSMVDCYCRTYGLCLEDKKEITMVERWNEFRTRGEELQWQVFRRASELKEKGWGKDSKKTLNDDWEYNRLQEEEQKVKQRVKGYRNMITQHWNLPESEQEW